MIFLPGKGNKKYTVILPFGKRVSFGDKRYQHYKDRTPLKLYTHLDHLDNGRRKRYRMRHMAIMKGNRRAIDVMYSPAWFSYHYLW